MKQTEVADILKKHLLWIHQRSGGTRADLSLKDLHRFNFDGMVLRRAKMARTNFSNCSMRNVDLVGADMFSAMLNGADLTGAKLDEADLDGASMENTHDTLPNAEDVR